MIKGLADAEAGAHLFSQAGSRQTVGSQLDAVLSAHNIAADGRQAAAGILNQRTDDHIGSHVRGFNPFYKFPVAVVHHADHVRLDPFNKADQLSDAGDGKGRPCGVALGPLDLHQLRFFVDRFADVFIVKGAVGQQVHLPVGNAEFLQGACGVPDSDHLL